MGSAIMKPLRKKRGRSTTQSENTPTNEEAQTIGDGNVDQAPTYKDGAAVETGGILAAATGATDKPLSLWKRVNRSRSRSTNSTSESRSYENSLANNCEGDQAVQTWVNSDQQVSKPNPKQKITLKFYKKLPRIPPSPTSQTRSNEVVNAEDETVLPEVEFKKPPLVPPVGKIISSSSLSNAVTPPDTAAINTKFGPVPPPGNKPKSVSTKTNTARKPKLKSEVSSCKDGDLTVTDIEPHVQSIDNNMPGGCSDDASTVDDQEDLDVSQDARTSSPKFDDLEDLKLTNPSDVIGGESHEKCEVIFMSEIDQDGSLGGAGDTVVIDKSELPAPENKDEHVTELDNVVFINPARKKDTEEEKQDVDNLQHESERYDNHSESPIKKDHDEEATYVDDISSKEIADIDECNTRQEDYQEPNDVHTLPPSQTENISVTHGNQIDIPLQSPSNVSNSDSDQCVILETPLVTLNGNKDEDPGVIDNGLINSETLRTTLLGDHLTYQEMPLEGQPLHDQNIGSTADEQDCTYEEVTKQPCVSTDESCAENASLQRSEVLDAETQEESHLSEQDSILSPKVIEVLSRVGESCERKLPPIGRPPVGLSRDLLGQCMPPLGSIPSNNLSKLQDIGPWDSCAKIVEEILDDKSDEPKNVTSNIPDKMEDANELNNVQMPFSQDQSPGDGSGDSPDQLPLRTTTENDDNDFVKAEHPVKTTETGASCEGCDGGNQGQGEEDISNNQDNQSEEAKPTLDLEHSSDTNGLDVESNKDENNAASSDGEEIRPVADLVKPGFVECVQRQLHEEGLKPSMRDGGVSFFVPIAEGGLQPAINSADIEARLSKGKTSTLNYEEKMMLANLNRQSHLSKLREFAVRDLNNVRQTMTSAAGGPSMSPRATSELSMSSSTPLGSKDDLGSSESLDEL